jgi:CDP-diglyceride synthetase
MDIKEMPVLWLLIITFLLVIISIEFGYLVGKAIRKRQEVETESTVSSISGYVLALLAFIIAFTFGIVIDRYQTRKDLVREEANLIRTTWMRADFLPDTQRKEAKNLIKEYTTLRLDAVRAHDLDQIQETIIKSAFIREQLWNMAVKEARKDMNSDVAALYIESLNDVANINASRVVVGLHTRIPEGIWEVLFVLMLLSMVSIGYQTSIAGSKRSWSTIIMAISFSLVIVMIETLDRPQSKLIPVSQYPMEHLVGELEKSN